MKLMEVVSTGNLESLLRAFLHSMKINDYDEMEEAKALIVTNILSKGWNKAYIDEFINELSTVANESQLYSLMGKYHIEMNESVHRHYFKYKIEIKIPLIKEEEIDTQVKSLLMHLNESDIQVKKHKHKIIDKIVYYKKSGEEGAEGAGGNPMGGQPPMGEASPNDEKNNKEEESEDQDYFIDLKVTVLAISYIKLSKIRKQIGSMYDVLDIEIVR